MSDFDVNDIENNLPVRFNKLVDDVTIAATFDRLDRSKLSSDEAASITYNYLIVIAPQNDLNSDERKIYGRNTLEDLKSTAIDFLNEGWSYTPPPEEKLTDEDGNALTGKQKKQLKRYTDRYIERERRREMKKRYK